jgi:hypothetical protein
MQRDGLDWRSITDVEQCAGSADSGGRVVAAECLDEGPDGGVRVRRRRGSWLVVLLDYRTVLVSTAGLGRVGVRPLRVG